MVFILESGLSFFTVVDTEPTVYQLHRTLFWEKTMRLASLLGYSVAFILTCVGSVHAADVGVSISIGQPGAYGRVTIGNVPPPPRALIYDAPRVIVLPPAPSRAAPIYMHVPSYHAEDWRRYCDLYDACGVPVYFIRDDYYQRYSDQYRPRPPEPVRIMPYPREPQIRPFADHRSPHGYDQRYIQRELRERQEWREREPNRHSGVERPSWHERGDDRRDDGPDRRVGAGR